MILPKGRENIKALHDIYFETLRQCEVSRADRQARARWFRTWYLTGTGQGSRSRYNKLAEHVEFSSSYLYAPDSVRFGVKLPPTHPEQTWDGEEDAATRELHRLWHETGPTLTFDVGVEWAHVWDTAVFKVITDNNRAALKLIPDPSNIGLLNEDLDEWDDQEAIAHWFTMSLPRFRRLVVSAIPDKTRQDAVIRAAELQAQPGVEGQNENALPAAMQTLLLAAVSPNLVGVVQAAGDTALAIPHVANPVVWLAELCVWDDEASDYRVVTMLPSYETVLWDLPNPLVPGEHPYHPLTLNPVPGYAWGVCPMERLIILQQWHEDKVYALDDREDKEIDPPIFAKGFTQITDEQMKAFRRKGGNITSPRPDAEMKPFPPSPMADPFGMLDRIDRMMARQGGLPQGMSGQTEAGVRSGGQALTQAALGAGPTLKKAMRVEACLDAVATSLLRLHRRVSDQPLRKLRDVGQPGEGASFLLSQMPGDFVAKVWAHSQSPIYAEKLMQKAAIAKQAGALEGEDLIELLDLPNGEKLKAKARKMAEAQAKRQDQLLEIQKMKAQRTGAGRVRS